MNDKEDHSRFTIHDDEAAPDSIFIADAENLRIEKLSNRVTLVAVLIPCLLVVVLAVAYLDIKNRVINTQNTGSMGVQNLSKDLESRFSKLSLKQAKIDQQLEETVETMQTATAALQVNLKKTKTEIKRIAKAKPDHSALAAMAKKTDGAMADLKKEIADLNTAFGNFDEELAAQILLMAEGLKKDQGRLAAIEQKTHQLETQQLSKDSMELTLGLERIALQEMVKDKVRALEKKLARISKQIDGLSQRMDAQTQKVSPSPPAPSATPLPPAATDTPSASTGIEEQTIN